MRHVFQKSIREHLRVVGAWTSASAILAGFYLSLYPSIGGVEEMSQLLEAMPPPIRAMFAAEGMDLSTPAGYLNLEFFGFILPLLVAAVTVTLGAGATAGEEERGSLDVLLSCPLPRWRVILAKAGAALVLGGVLVAGVWVGLAVTAVVCGIDVALDRVAAALGSVWLLGLVLGGVALVAGSLSGSRMLSIGVALGIAVVGFFVNALAPLVESLRPWQALSPHYHYLAGDPLTNGLDPGHALTLAAASVALAALATVVFQRRDLRA